MESVRVGSLLLFSSGWETGRTPRGRDIVVDDADGTRPETSDMRSVVKVLGPRGEGTDGYEELREMLRWWPRFAARGDGSWEI